ncbi:hypothetical protein MPC1_4520003 [Methylocella tundrae]|nr:hypothetical protein MPC1_4520003 [Methylocella tundrae]
MTERAVAGPIGLSTTPAALFLLGFELRRIGVDRPSLVIHICLRPSNFASAAFGVRAGAPRELTVSAGAAARSRSRTNAPARSMRRR